MTTLHLVRLRVNTPALMRFAKDQGLLRDREDGFGYTLHAWLAAMFGAIAPKPFRFDERRAELLGYAAHSASDLTAQAKDFALPQVIAALQPDSLVSKPMPTQWPEGKRVQLHVLACPVSRKDGQEKDVYLRALDHRGDDTPSREEVYRVWMRRHIEHAVHIERLEIVALVQRHRLLRPDRSGGGRRLRALERPRVTFMAEVSIGNGTAFQQLLARGIGRHRAFGFGMMLLAPVP